MARVWLRCSKSDAPVVHLTLGRGNLFRQGGAKIAQRVLNAHPELSKIFHRNLEIVSSNLVAAWRTTMISHPSRYRLASMRRLHANRPEGLDKHSKQPINPSLRHRYSALSSARRDATSMAKRRRGPQRTFSASVCLAPLRHEEPADVFQPVQKTALLS